ncbi:MAG: aminomethyltransferase family protein [Eubacteriales bacterium]|nr:aminomethyltransferase family protein [Eubacteriales bacterium]
MISKDQSVREQHLAVRNCGGWYDFTHRLLEIEGEDVTAFLDWIFAGAVARVKVGGAKYTVMLDASARIRDDVIIFRLEEQKYWISTLYMRDLIKWLDGHKGTYRVSYRDVTKDWQMYSVQGPKARELVNAVAEQPVDELKFFHIADNQMDGAPIKVARSGYTGEKVGYEIYVSPADEQRLTEKLEAEGTKLGLIHVTEVDVMAMTLACEKGFVLMMDLWRTNPLEVGFEKSIAWDTEFIGKAALERIREEGPKRELLGITVDDLDARIYGGPHGATVMLDGNVIGKTTKYTFSPILNKSIGYVLVDKGLVKVGDTVEINGVKAVISERRFLP